MPVTIEINTEARLVLSTFSGEISESGFTQFISTVRSWPGFDPSFDHILDFSNVTDFNLSTNYLQQLAARTPIFKREARQIVVAPQTHIFGLSRMTQMLRQKELPNVRVVQVMTEAQRILKETGDH